MALIDAETILRTHNFRRTPARIAIIETLAKERFPVRTEVLQKKITAIDTVTLYRALEAFVKVGIVERSDFQHGHAHYELVYGRPHHHHAICEGCGVIADVPAGSRERLNQDALTSVPGFSSITHHSLEFFGRCTTCA